MTTTYIPRNKLNRAGCEILTAVTVKSNSTACWNLTPYSLESPTCTITTQNVVLCLLHDIVNLNKLLLRKY
jgi:hypothetical protein